MSDALQKKAEKRNREEETDLAEMRLIIQRLEQNIVSSQKEVAAQKRGVAALRNREEQLASRLPALLRIDFAQMLYDGGSDAEIDKVRLNTTVWRWLRSDEALRLSLDLRLRHFTRSKLLASLGVERGACIMREAISQDIYPRLVNATAGEWMENYEQMLNRWICPLPGVVVGGKPGEEPLLWVPPPAHRWEEMLGDVLSLAEKIRLMLGERAMFRGMNFWFTELHRLAQWPAGSEKLRELCAEAWQRDDMENNRVFTYADYFGSVLGAQMAREFGGWLRFTVRPEWKPAAYDRDGVADWMEDHLYGRLHASLVALTSSATGEILRRAATVPESVTGEELESAFRILHFYTRGHVMGHLGETFGTMVLKQQLAGEMADDVCFIPGQAIWVEGEGGRKQGPDALLARINWDQDSGVKLEVVGIVEMKAYRVSATRLLEQIHLHEQRMTAGKVTLLTLTPPNGEPVWHGRAEMTADGATTEIPVTELTWSAGLRRIAVLPSAKQAAKASRPSLEVIEMPWTPTGFRRMGWRVLTWYGENLGRTADPDDYELGRTSWITCVERLLHSPKAIAATGRFLPQLHDTLQTTGRDPDEDRAGWAWSGLVEPKNKTTMTLLPQEWKIDYQAAADHCYDADYSTHARRLIESLSDEISWVYYENISFPASIKEVVTGMAVFLFDKEEVQTPPELIETHTYLLKESRVIGAMGISSPAITKRPSSRGFQMSNMYGRTEEVFGKSYDKGHHVCHGAGGSADWNLFPQLRSLNRGWSDEGKLYREMEAYVAANPGTMFFSRPIHLDGSLCPSLLEYGVLMPADRKVWWATFSNVPDVKEQAYGRKKKVPMPPELAGIPEYGRRRKKGADGSAMPSASSLSVMIVRRSKPPRPKPN